MDDMTYRIKRRIRDLESAILDLQSGQPDPNVSRRYLGSVFANPTIPTSVPKYFATHPVSVSFDEIEGGPVTKKVDVSKTVYVGHVGTVVPVVNDIVIARSVGPRWVAGLGSSGSGPPVGDGVALQGCSCGSVPRTLYMTVESIPPGNCFPGDFYPCTLVFGPVPASLASLNLDSPPGFGCFLSAETFTDTYTNEAYRVFFGCDGSQFRISRVYLPHDDKGPYRDATSYTWAIGLAGNSCIPLSLRAGTIYPGGNPRCKVYIDQ